ncbi:tRNA adenylyltransferase/tRNA cytidylyltransferase [Treponema primitia ZAS-2]|uniref:tRNA adenylyltransferase/tRNA cytidylyltransferase n=1 Tax=Treponema primitia (strain ATCC BAA-887 / DSM 12427 / ZAS-2) TaxID=545694 RepID=F5YR49_TREPZ|nr:CCA tRNA nucleotidyltransferase [Treponema primitia]AEF85082.1 tRNA adenylyltransferase/tRNA cytidylyltransferase [Treponema primitia ZAS-2]
MDNAAVHPILKEVASVFTRAGKQVYLVGGAVRDLLLGKEAKDWDLATDARPEEVIALFRRVIPTGIKHGTVTVRYKSNSLEVTTFRTESTYSDGRRPDQVNYAATIEEDLSRRDLTMNAIALSLPSGTTVDPFKGIEDIQNRRIRCVGNPEERFGEDGLRPLRALRFASQLNFTVDEATLAAIPGALSTTVRVSPERIRDELDKIISSDRPSIALLLMEKTGLLELILPELASCRGVEQKGFHRFDVLDHSLLACDYAARLNASREVRMASLFHDIGKPTVCRIDESGVRTFYQHEQVSADLARRIALRLRYPNALTERLVHLIREHMFHYEESWTDAAVRRFIIRVGEENLKDIYALRQADAFATAGIEGEPGFLAPLVSRVDAILAESRALSLKDLAVSGADLISAGVPKGPRLGIILKELLETVLDDPELNTREKLLEIAGNLNRRYTSP